VPGLGHRRAEQQGRDAQRPSHDAGEGGPLLFAGPLVAAMMGFTISADVAYDHSAFSLHAGISTIEAA
jgi:hypothetical protein